MVASQSIVGRGDSWSASHDKGYYSSFTVADTGYHCTDFSVQEDWTQGENSFEHTFPDEGPWLISYSSCCWISLANGGNGDWFLSTSVNLTKRQDNGRINSSPISALSPIVRHQQGCSKTITIPAEDSDGDKVRCRWSTGSRRECGSVCQRFQSGNLDEEKCTLSLYSNAALGWHAVAITLEDYPASTTNFQSATPFSHVSLQFLVHVSPSSGPCNRAPVLIGQTPNDGSCEEVSNGDTFKSIIEAKHIDSSRSIVEIITVTPLYMVITGLLNYTDQIGDTVFYRNASWNPRLSQKGRHIFCFKAVDNYGIESEQRCITIIVGSNNTPNPLLYSRVPVVPRLSWPWWFGFVDFNITFDQQIKRPRHSKFIRIVLEDHVIYKLDTRSSSDVTVDKFSLRFRLPQVVLSMRGNYSITMDRGVVVGLGCTSDGPPSPGMSSLKDWPFDVGVCSKGTYMDHNYRCNDVNECSKAPSILSRKKRNPWGWYWQYYTTSAQAMVSSMQTSSFSPTPAFAVAMTSSISGVCSHYLYQQNGQFTSPNYPGRYSNNLYCTWLIEAPYGYYIYLQFGSFHLESCCDWVQIFDGSSAYSSRIISENGYQQPWGVCSTGRFLFVQFTTDWSSTYSGFSATYQAVSHASGVGQVFTSAVNGACYGSSLKPSEKFTNLVSPTRSSTHIPLTSSVIGACSYYLYQRNGRFTSPGHPNRYSNRQHCTWLIEVPYGHFIYLQFGSFHLEGCCDWVQIFDGSSAYSSRITSKNGYQQPWGVCSSGRFLFVQFTTDGSVTYSGFSATYQAVPHASGVHQVYASSAVGSCYGISSIPYLQQTRDSLAITPTRSSAYIPWTVSANECTSHYFLEDFGRSVNYVGNNVTCDRGLSHGWYRFRGAAGTQMPSSCVGMNRCGTHAPGWLNGAHPTVADGIVRVSVCFHWNWRCCRWSTTIRVRNCGGFYVYELGSPPYCHLRYCGASTVQSTPVMRKSLGLNTSSYARATSTVQSTPVMSISPGLNTSSYAGANSLYIKSTVAMLTSVASSTPFVLHLPANCQHDCVNNWGSYYCTCRQGYRLEADGKTCQDINECLTQNGGCTHECVNIPGGHYCKCPEGVTMGFDNKTCHEPGITVKCTDEAMFIFLERKSFQGFDPNKLTLLYPSCRASYNDSHISLRTSLNDCGTTHNESEDAITFHNKVQSVQSYSGNIITREQNVSIPFYCSYGRKAQLRNPSFRIWKNYFTASEGGYGNFTFTMDLFKTGRYLTTYSYNDYPITVHLRDRLFLQLAVRSYQSNLVLFVDTCKATPSPDPYSVPQYIFLQRGCKLDATLNYSYSISSKQRFSIQAFRFIEEHPVVHLHCEVLACHRNTARSRCLQGCSRYRGRRDEVPGSESTQMYKISSGPIKFQKGSSGTNREKKSEAETQTNMGIITVAAASGGILLLLVIILVIVIIRIKKRLKGAFADRNKVYAMEQCSKYVKQENNNLGFTQDDELNEMGDKSFIMKPLA
ncbi:Oncoprotein-induced transcript 3 protein [Stylophora pistillata]|uniref:Oncoprotein-induced transcript 3 protein n=2 Tax=Stylophora pistillata TaxID=50429 RepID=A0A2B4SBK6_STYPI|nr:Oncoprotein-induced transcript 3 protein [Stylophora pistillata]